MHTSSVTRTRRAASVVLTTMALGAATMVPAVAAPQASTTTTYQVASVAIPNGPVTRNDGNPTYSGGQTTAYIRDGSVTSTDGFQDWIFLRVAGKGSRFLSLQDPGSGSGFEACAVAEIEATSASLPDWYHQLGATPVRADGAVRCYKDSRRQSGWIVGYPNGAAECLTLARPSARTWVLSAPADCPSVRWNVVNGKVQPPTRSWADGIAAEFTATWNQS